jgi:hypothetical protein
MTEHCQRIVAAKVGNVMDFPNTMPTLFESCMNLLIISEVLGVPGRTLFVVHVETFLGDVHCSKLTSSNAISRGTDVCMATVGLQQHLDGLHDTITGRLVAWNIS